MTWLQAFIIAVVEGITEFLPVSSTGHMIITQYVLGMESTDFIKLFTVNIQFGAILSVIFLYFKRFFKSVRFYITLFIAFIPAAIAGLLFGDVINAMLESVVVTAISLVVGGVILLFVDKWINNKNEDREPNYSEAFKIGLFQVIAMIPGVSRSAATIIGGMTQKLNRKSAAEFSFFLAVPTMFAASAYELLKTHESITSDNIGILLFGNLIAFIVAMLAIKFFISFITKYGLKVFGYYRIVVGAAILFMVLSGIEFKML